MYHGARNVKHAYKIIQSFTDIQDYIVYIVYRKSGAPSITRLPRSACLLQYQNHTLRLGTMTKIKRLHLSNPLAKQTIEEGTEKTHAMVVHIPGLYSGASCDRNATLLTIPPIPPNPTSVALEKARVH